MLAAAGAMANLASGCASRWPSVQARADGAFAERRLPVHTIDVLPMDVEVWVAPTRGEPPELLRRQFDDVARGAVAGHLAQRGYAVAAEVDWDGTYVGYDGAVAEALAPDDLIATVAALSGYGEAVGASGQLLVPHLPARLGTSGADATLYVGGWAYVGKDASQSSTGTKVAKGVVIGLIVVAVVAVVIIGLERSGGGGGKVASGGGGGVGRAAGGAGRVAVRAAGNAATSTARVGGTVLRGAVRAGNELIHASADAFGRTHTHIEVYGGRPAYYQQEPRRPDPARSQMLVEMTLVDNRTGLVLWHARQAFPASAARPAETAQVMARLLATLP
jgi:hypothetical protein